MNKRILSGVKRLATRKIMLLVASKALAVVLTSCAAQKGRTGPTKPSSPSRNGKIAFARSDNQAGDTDIFVVEPDGSGLRKLVTKPAQDNFPAWSPNGERLAFEASEGPNSLNIDIYVMNADGSRRARNTAVGVVPTCVGPLEGGRSDFASLRALRGKSARVRWVSPGGIMHGAARFVGKAGGKDDNR